MRRSGHQLQRDLIGEFTAAARELGLPVRRHGRSADWWLDLEGRRITLRTFTVAYATPQRIATLDLKGGAEDLTVVIAHRINGPAKDRLRSAGAGYYESDTGELYLRAAGLWVDLTTQGRLRRRPGTTGTVGGITGRVGRSVAFEALRRVYDGEAPLGAVRDTAARLGVAKSSVGDAQRNLMAAGLIDASGEPTIPELFWELAKVWAPSERRWLAAVPSPDEVARTAGDESRWRVGGLNAALEYGAPAVIAGLAAVELYVPAPVLLTIAERRYGAADPVSAAAVVAVPAVDRVTAADGAAKAAQSWHGWELVHPLVAALDLAAVGDERARQILDEWVPTDGTDVWHEQ